MLIIDQWATDATGFITDDIKITEEEDKDGEEVSCLYVNGKRFAKSKDSKAINKLQYKLHAFVDKHKRTTDTFDIAAELNNLDSDYSYSDYRPG